VARIARITELPGPISAAEDLWYDLRRRPSFVEGFGHVVRVEGGWPGPGSRVVWDAPPQGRGRVVETVDAFEARAGQTVHVEDGQLRGIQTTTFAPAGDSPSLVRVTLSFDWELKEGNVVTDWLLVRRKIGESLRRTLVKYRIERLADLDDERALAAEAP
jgi:hypothetical protein